MWPLIAEWRGRSLKKEREDKTTLRMSEKKIRNYLPKITHNASKSMCINTYTCLGYVSVCVYACARALRLA